MKAKAVIAIIMLATSAMAQERITWKEKDSKIFSMTNHGEDLYIDGEKYLITPSVLEAYEKVRHNMYIDMSYFCTRGLSFFHWGYYSGGTYGTFHNSWMLKGKKLYMTDLTFYGPYEKIMDEHKKKSIERGLGHDMPPYSADTLLVRMERATGCKFGKDSTMFMKTFNGEFYAKRANTAPTPKERWGKDEWEFPEYAAWWHEPIYKLSFKNGKLVEMAALEEIPEPEHGDSIFTYKTNLDIFPEFGKNDHARNNHMSDHIVYPEASIQAGHEGMVTLDFVVEKDGIISDIQVYKSSGHAELDEAALSAMRTMTPWKPASHYGRPVRFRQHHSVLFYIPKSANYFPELPKGYRWSSVTTIRAPKEF